MELVEVQLKLEGIGSESGNILFIKSPGIALMFNVAASYTIKLWYSTVYNTIKITATYVTLQHLLLYKTTHL